MESRSEKIKAFNSILESFLAQVSPLIGTTYHYYFKKLISVNAPLPIKYAATHLVVFRDQILSKDEAYFESKDDNLTSKFSEVTGNSNISPDEALGEIMRLKDVYYQLDTKSRDNVWDILQALLQLAMEYNS